MKSEDLSWRKAKIAALILHRERNGRLSARDRRIAAVLAEDEAVSNRLIEQALCSLQSRHVRAR